MSNVQLKTFDFKSLSRLEMNTFITIVGMTKSGKGYWANECLYWLNKSKKAGHYKDIFLFSKTADIQDPEKYFPMIPDNRRYTDLENINKIIEIRKKSKKKENVMIILDDITSMKENGKMFRNSESVINLACHGRHLNLSVLCLLQKDTLVSPIIRTNSSYVINFLAKSYRDLVSVKERYLSLVDKKTADQVFNDVFSKPYQCLVCDQAKPGTVDILDFCYKSIAPAKLRKFNLNLNINPNSQNKNKSNIDRNDEGNKICQTFTPQSRVKWEIQPNTRANTKGKRTRSRKYG